VDWRGVICEEVEAEREALEKYTRKGREMRVNVSLFWVQKSRDAGVRRQAHQNGTGCVTLHTPLTLEDAQYQPDDNAYFSITRYSRHDSTPTGVCAL